MRYSFHAYSHPNMIATHKTTLEFTKEKNLSLKGNCIVGVNADFELEKIKKLIRNSKSKSLKISISAHEIGIREEIAAQINTHFCDKNEIVIRKTDFISERTLGIKSDKAACDLGRKLIEYLRLPDKKVDVEVSVIQEVKKFAFEANFLKKIHS